MTGLTGVLDEGDGTGLGEGVGLGDGLGEGAGAGVGVTMTIPPPVGDGDGDGDGVGDGDRAGTTVTGAVDVPPLLPPSLPPHPASAQGAVARRRSVRSRVITPVRPSQNCRRRCDGHMAARPIA
ncbi:MAG: hypothetical protein PGN12_01345 [Sphingomonas phyllosphaerae]